MIRLIEKSGQTLTEPVTLAQAKAHLYRDSSDDDDYITGLITAAREACENDAKRSFIQRSFIQYFNSFPTNLEAIQLDIGPLKETAGLTHVKYIDVNGTLQTFAAANYIVHSASFMPRIELAPDKTWPDTRLQESAVTIEFIAGISPCPGSVKQAILLVLGAMFKDREAFKFPEGACHLLSAFTEAVA